MGLSREEITFIAVSLFIFHEANHIVQGIPDYTGVQTIKKSGGSDLICELDIISDGIAARILAGINLLGQAVSWDAYFKQVHGALTLSFLILTKSFPFKPSKSTKVARGLSLLVMRERITDAIYQANFDKSQIYAVKASVSEKMCKIFVITLECQIRAVLSLSDISSVNIQKLGKQISLGDIEEAENLLMGNYQSKFPIASSGS